MKILLVRLSALGDIASALPALGALRRGLPGAEVHWLVEDRGAALVRMVPGIDRVHVYERRRLVDGLRRFSLPALLEFVGFVRAMRRERFDAALDFQGNLKSGALVRLSGARRRIGFARERSREWSGPLLNERVPIAAALVHRVETQAALLAALGVDPAPSPVAPEPPAADRASVEARLAEIAGAGPLVVLHPGTSEFGAFKRWPPERFGAVARRLAEGRGARCLVTFGPEERGLAEAVVRASGGAARLFESQGLGELAALLARSDLVLGGDTGPVHLASALGRPVVALYGPKDPAVYGPYGPGAEAVRSGVDCSPCALRRCDDPQCMLRIAEGPVMEAAERRLGGAEP